MRKELSDIQAFPTVHDNVHESIYKSYQILQYVKGMLERGDSQETISDVINQLEIDFPKELIKDVIHETVKFCNDKFDDHPNECVNVEEANKFMYKYCSKIP